MPVRSAVVVNTLRWPGINAPPNVGSRKYFCPSSQVATSRTTGPGRHGRLATAFVCCQGMVISGAARRCTIRPDGRRQIVDLLLPGDFCNFAMGEEWDVTIEAVTEGTVVAAYPRRRIEMLADSDPKIAHEIRKIAYAALSRLQAQLLILGRITALEKVGSFILEMAARLSDGDADQVALPVSRYDIADYLGVSVETVSRSLSDLKQRGAIKLLGTRTVSIVDRDVLEEGERNEHRCHA